MVSSPSFLSRELTGRELACFLLVDAIRDIEWSKIEGQRKPVVCV